MIKFLTQGTIAHRDSTGQAAFVPSDTEQLYRANLKRQKKNWHYRTQPVHYQLNSEGYRADEWTNIDWCNTVVVQGCSAAFGIGLAESETVSCRLSRLIDTPVIDLSVPGGSVYVNWHNLVTLLTAGAEYRPRAVVNLWTDWTRLTRFDAMTDQVRFWNLGSWDRDPLYQAWNRTAEHAEQSALLIQRSTRLALAQAGIPLVESSHFDHSARLFGCHSQQIIDRARDLIHPGPETAAQLAEYLAEQLTPL